MTCSVQPCQSVKTSPAQAGAGCFLRQRRLIFDMARQDFRNRYVGAMLGLVWSFVQPLVMTLILWAVITLAFNTNAVRGVPFALWLLTGLAAWNYFSEALFMTTGVFQEYAFLVKKVRFDITILPLVKIGSTLVAHIIFLLIVMLILWSSGIWPSLYWLQLLYYMLALVMLLQGLSWLTSALNVFARDVAYIVNVLLQFGFWMTPIFWDSGMLPERYQQSLALFIKLNPLAYIVLGYRQSFFLHTPFWADMSATLYFWAITGALLLAGGLVFRKLKPHFADVL